MKCHVVELFCAYYIIFLINGTLIIISVVSHDMIKTTTQNIGIIIKILPILVGVMLSPLYNKFIKKGCIK
jgi:hypothetical protein